MMGTDSPSFRSLPELLAWCRKAPTGTRLDACQVAEILAGLDVEAPSHRSEGPEEVRVARNSWTWREKLWTVPAETRLGVAEASEALGRPKSFIYARTGPSAEDPIPHRKFDGTLVFTAGELRAWTRDREEAIAAGPMESTEAERKGRLHAL